MGLISLFLKKAYTVPAYFFVHTDWMMFARQVLNFDHHSRGRLRRLLRAFYQGFDGLFVLNKDQRVFERVRGDGVSSGFGNSAFLSMGVILSGWKRFISPTTA